MNIDSIYGSTGTSLLESLYAQSSKASSEEKGDGVTFFGMDSVSISEEAKEKVAAMAAAKSEDENVQSENDAETDAATGGSGGRSGDSTSKLQSLKGKLSSLQSSLWQANDFDAAGINAQISQIMGEIAALEAEGA